MRKRRIAIFTGNYNHIRDGVSNTLNRLVGHLEAKEFEVRVFGPWSPDPVIEHNGTYIPVYAVPAPGRPEYRISMGLPETEKELLREFKPDLIHIATPDILGFMALRFAMKNGIPAVASYHTHFSSYLKYYRMGFIAPLLTTYLLWFYRHCEHLYIPSPSMLEDLKKLGVETELKLWSRGVDTELFNPDKKNEAWRAEKGFKEGHFVVTFVSRLVWEKNLMVVAEIFQELRRRNPAIRTMIVGDGPARQELSEILPDTVFTGHLEGEELARSYACSDLFFFPSDTESFGNVTLEAMASGLPAVVAEASGSRSLVENNENGFRAGSMDKKAFLEHILHISENEDIRNHMAVASRKKSLQYDWERIMDSLVACYNEVI
ncbi:glycosyltransferase family 1 protein [Balneolales bacterium ANBcel1]|nr:glycosyltransferase family 1 protein [Balneolales bacterium ANBcel1]